ncbi:MAG: peptide ABC transporter substrate-binding protein, partial [Vulcanimicrobiaceae bacterium]
MLAALCACTRASQQPASGTSGGERHSWSIPGVLRIGIQSPPNSLQGIFTSNTTEVMIDRLVYDPLITVDASGKKLIPVLAAEVPTLENGGISKDGLSITYKLRRNVKWQDGTPFTSADVKFSWKAIMNPANNVGGSRNGYNLVRAIDTPDAHTAIFRLKEKFAPAVNTFFAESDSPVFVIPKHLLDKYPNINNVPFNNNPVGTGPFKFSKWARGDHLEFVANDDYFLGKPKLKQIVVKIIPDENTALNELRAHELDWIFEASPQLYGQLKGLPDVNNLLVDQNQVQEMLMNTTSPILADVAVRRALAYAIDKQSIVSKLTFDTANAADEEHPPFMWAHVGGKTYPYDPAKAKSVLDADGWKTGPDGIRRKNGRRLSLTLSTNTTNVTRRSAAVLLQAYFKAIGVELQVKSYLGTQLFAPKGVGGILANAKYELALSGWIAGIDPDDSVRFMCRSFPPDGANYTRYCTKEMDAAQTVALEHYDEPTRKMAYATIQALIFRDMPQD